MLLPMLLSLSQQDIMTTRHHAFLFVQTSASLPNYVASDSGVETVTYVSDTIEPM